MAPVTGFDDLFNKVMVAYSTGFWEAASTILPLIFPLAGIWANIEAARKEKNTVI